MTQTPTPAPPAPATRRPTTPAPAWVRRLAWLAVLGPVVFGLTTQALILLQWDFLSQFADLNDEFPISPNALGPFGPLMVLNFLVLGASVVALAALLWRAGPTNAVARVGVALLGIAGVGLALEAAPMEFPPATHWWGKLHFAAFYVWALSLFLGYIVLGAGLLRERAWQGVGAFTLGTAVLTVALVFTAPWSTTDVVTKHGAWWGPLGRAHFIVWIAWFSLVAWRTRAALAAPTVRPPERAVAPGGW